MPRDVGDPERWELFVNRKEGVIHRRFQSRSLEQCNLDQAGDYFLTDEAMLDRLVKQGMRQCEHCWADAPKEPDVDVPPEPEPDSA